MRAIDVHILERIYLAVDLVRRRWRLILLPIGLITVLAFIGVKTASPRYTTSTTVMLKAANQASWTPGTGQLLDANTVEQVRGLEAWLKSDHVLDDLIPQLMDTPMPMSLEGLYYEKIKLRSALRLVLVGNTLLKLELDGSNPNGLSRKLEIILSHFLERLLLSDDGILSATQLVLVRRSDEASAAEKALVKQIEAAGLAPTAAVISHLRERRLGLGAKPSGNGSLEEATPAGAASRKEHEALNAAHRVPGNLSADGEVVRRLEALYAKAVEARNNFESAKANLASKDGSYVKIFEAPENLRIIGRPRDPIVGENPLRKIGIAMILMSVLIGGALAFLADFFDGRLRSRRDFERMTELPVIARLQKVAI